MESFYLFVHSIQSLFQPLCISLVLLVLGFVIWKSCQKTAKTLVIIAALSLWCLSMPLVAQQLINGLQNQFPPEKFQALTSAKNNPAIVVLGGGMQFATENDEQYIPSETTIHRLYYSVFLAKKLHLPIIVSGGNPLNSAITEAAVMNNMLKDYFNISARWEENQSINTLQESQYLLPILLKNNIDTIYLVTNAWHMARAYYIFNYDFKKSKIKIIPASIGYIKCTTQPEILNYFPNIDAMRISTLALHEYIGIIWYSIYHH